MNHIFLLFFLLFSAINLYAKNTFVVNIDDFLTEVDSTSKSNYQKFTGLRIALHDVILDNNLWNKEQLIIKHSNGNYLAICELDNGSLNGMARINYLDGTINKYVMFADNRRNGSTIVYNPDGTISNSYFFKNGELLGDSQFYEGMNKLVVITNHADSMELTIEFDSVFNKNIEKVFLKKDSLLLYTEYFAPACKASYKKRGGYYIDSINTYYLNGSLKEMSLGRNRDLSLNENSMFLENYSFGLYSASMLKNTWFENGQSKVNYSPLGEGIFLKKEYDLNGNLLELKTYVRNESYEKDWLFGGADVVNYTFLSVGKGYRWVNGKVMIKEYD